MILAWRGMQRESVRCGADAPGGRRVLSSVPNLHDLLHPVVRISHGGRAAASLTRHLPLHGYPSVDHEKDPTVVVAVRVPSIE